MVRTIDPNAEVVRSDLADSGYLPVYHLTVETGSTTRDLVLKATLGEGSHGVALEARLLALLEERTSIPVPGVVGAVDDHDDLPAPFFLMAELSGHSIPRTELGDVPADRLAAIARSMGTYLAELHALDVVDAFGYLGVTEPLACGGRPPVDADAIRVADPEESWPACLRAWAEAELDAHEDTRFGDLTPEVRPVLLEAVDGVSDAPPALAHVDASIENVLLDDDGAVCGVLDWAFTVAAPPAYDLVCVERALAGGHWSFVPGTPDFGPAVREGLVEGYRSAGSPAALDRYRDERRAYDLLWIVRMTNLFDGWFETKGVDPERTEAAAREARETLSALL